MTRPNYMALDKRCRELAAVVAGIELSMGLAPGALRNTAIAAESLERLSQTGAIDAALVTQNLTLHDAIKRLRVHYPVKLTSGTLFDQLLELIEVVLERADTAAKPARGPIES